MLHFVLYHIRRPKSIPFQKKMPRKCELSLIFVLFRPFESSFFADGDEKAIWQSDEGHEPCPSRLCFAAVFGLIPSMTATADA